MTTIRLAYFYICEVSTGIHRGGLLTVDERGRPIDFRCTSAIRPNALQRILYGSTMTDHLGIDLCAVPLVQEMPERPDVILVRSFDPAALGAHTDVPVVRMDRQAQADVPGGGQDVIEIVASASGLFETVTLSGQPGREEDLTVAAGHVREIGSRIDPMEPFERIAAALKLVQEKPAPRG